MASSTGDIDMEYEIIFSECDEESSGLGWYVQRFPDGETSQSFKSKEDAREAYWNDELIFEEN